MVAGLPTLAETDEAVRRQRRGHPAVVCLNGYHRQDLARIEQRDDRHVGSHSGQRPVVRAAAPPQPGPGRVDRERRHEDDLRPGQRLEAEPFAGGLTQDPQRSTRTERPGVGDPVQVAVGPQGRKQEAVALFERVLSLRNAFGLFSEDADYTTGELWGNFPQTYSMVGLINSAVRLSRSWEEAF